MKSLPGNLPALFLFAIFSGAISVCSENTAYIFSVVATFFFFRKRLRVIILSAVILTFVINNYLTVIIEKAYENKNYKTYYTIDGKIRASSEYHAGDFILGMKKKIEEKNYYEILPGSTFRIPLVSVLMEYRKELSQKIFLLSGGEIQILQGLVLGDKKYIDNYKKDLFTVAGLNHYLAISGMHIGIIAAIFIMFIPFMHRKLKVAVLSFLMLFFIFITGIKIPVLRAVVFLFVFSASYILDVKVRFKEFVILIGSLFILMSPTIMTNISFILSFSAVLGIAFIVDNKKGIFVNTVITSLAATVFTMPFVVYFFGFMNIFSIVNTILLFPIIYLHILTGIMGLFFTGLMITPAVFTESIMVKMLEFLVSFERTGIITNSLPGYVFFVSIVIILFSVIFSKKYTVILLPIIILFPYKVPGNGYYFPEYRRSKAFVRIVEEEKHVYFKGFYSDYRYNFIPFLIKNGIGMKFDSGFVQIYDGKNILLEIKKDAEKFEDICVDNPDSDCRFVFFTNTGYLKKNMIFPDKKYIIYNSSYDYENIYKLKRKKLLFFDEKGELKSADKNQ